MNGPLLKLLGQILGSAYPRWAANRGTWGVFATVLEGLDQDAILAASWSWVREQKWPPSPADIRERAERYDRFLRDGPGNQVVHFRWQGYEHAMDAEGLRGLDLWPEIKQAIQEQTKAPVDEHLRRWELEQQQHKEARRSVLRRRACGDWSDGEDHPLLGTGSSSTIVEDTP